MGAVSNQLQTGGNNPIPYHPERFPFLMKLLQKVVMVVIPIFVGGFLGFSVGLGSFRVEIIDAASWGILIGAIVGVAQAFFGRVADGGSRYRMQALDQLKSTTSSPIVIDAIETLKQFFEYPLDRVRHHHDVAQIHRLLDMIGQRLDYEQQDVMTIWKFFLDHLDKTPLSTPDGTQVVLEMDHHFSRLRNETMAVTIGWLHGWFWTKSSSDLESLLEIRRRSLGSGQLYSEEEVRGWIQRNSGFKCAVARGDNHTVIGYMWAQKQGDVIEIGEMGLDPKGAIIGVETRLLQQLLKSYRASDQIIIRLRESDPLIGFYQQNGFIPQSGEPSTFTLPKEKAITLVLNWERVHN